MKDMCELVSLNSLERIYDVKRALERRGIAAEVYGQVLGARRYAQGSGRLRLMVQQRDLVYARWVSNAAGVDAWPDEDDGDEARVDGDAEGTAA